MAKEISGTISSFGLQVLSTRTSTPNSRFGTSKRPQQSENQSRATSTGVDTRVSSAFGHQQLSRTTTAPFHTFGNKYGSDCDMQKEGTPGPGSFEVPLAFGKQTMSGRLTQPSWRVGTSSRFSTYKTVWKADFETPAADNYRPSSGWLGDAPKYSFHGNAHRSDVRAGLPGCKPTRLQDPGPGQYEQPSSLGVQHDSCKQSAWRTRVGTASRERIAKSQYIGNAHEKDLFGKHSPAPNTYDPRQSLAKTSRVNTAPSFGFGSGDRFSQVKTRNVSKLPGSFTPGPGSYVV